MLDLAPVLPADMLEQHRVPWKLRRSKTMLNVGAVPELQPAMHSKTMRTPGKHLVEPAMQPVLRLVEPGLRPATRLVAPGLWPAMRLVALGLWPVMRLVAPALQPATHLVAPELQPTMRLLANSNSTRSCDSLGG